MSSGLILTHVLVPDQAVLFCMELNPCLMFSGVKTFLDFQFHEVVLSLQQQLASRRQNSCTSALIVTHRHRQPPFILLHVLFSAGAGLTLVAVRLPQQILRSSQTTR